MDILSNIPTGWPINMLVIPLVGLAKSTLMPEIRLHSVDSEPALPSLTAVFRFDGRLANPVEQQRTEICKLLLTHSLIEPRHALISTCRVLSRSTA
jgi:hypothetical protein